MHLSADNLCEIYETRPLICRVDEFYERYMAETITRPLWHAMNYAHCEELKRGV